MAAPGRHSSLHSSTGPHLQGAIGSEQGIGPNMQSRVEKGSFVGEGNMAAPRDTAAAHLHGVPLLELLQLLQCDVRDVSTTGTTEMTVPSSIGMRGMVLTWVRVYMYPHYAYVYDAHEHRARVSSGLYSCTCTTPVPRPALPRHPPTGASFCCTTCSSALRLSNSSL